MVDRLSPEHRALLRFLARVHVDNGAKPLATVAAAMNLKSKSRVSHLLRGTAGALPVDDAQLAALVRALGGGTDEIARGRQLYGRAKRARAASGRPSRPVVGDSSTGADVVKPLVGRQRELASLRDWTADLVRGKGRTVLVEGEPGIGKSSLGRAAAAHARAAGCQVLWGACDELSRVFPLLPLLDALDAHTARGRPKIADLLRASPAPEKIDPVAVATERLLALVEELCTTAPVALIVDDLQWADPATVAALGRIARLVRRLPLLLLGLTRPVPRRRDLHALRRAVDPAGRLSVESLSEPEVAELVAATAGGNPGARLLRLAAAAAGNPLYLMELVDALLRADLLKVERGQVEAVGSGAPDSLRAAIADRLEFLRAPVLDLLRAAALLGVEFSVSELAVVVSRPVNELLPLLEEALLAGVLRGDGSELAFRHPMIHGVLYEQMPPAMRAAWHRDAGRALAEAGAPTDRVARQLLPAVDADHQVDSWTAHWLADAGQDLVGRAPRAAIPLLRSAMTVIPVGVAPHDLLACRLADAFYRVGDAVVAAEVAARALDALSQPELIVDLMWTLTQSWAAEGRLQEALDLVRRALDRPDVTPVQRARLLVLVARMLRGRGDVAAAGAVAEEALASATAAGDRWATGWALAVLTLVHGMRADADTAVSLSRRALAVTEDDPALADLRLLLQVNQAAALGDLDRYDEAIGVAEQVRRLARQTGNTVRYTQGSSVLGEVLFDIGRWDDALAVGAVAAEGGSAPVAQCCAHAIAAIIGLHRYEADVQRHLAHAYRYAARLDGRVVGLVALAKSLDSERHDSVADALAALMEGVAAASQQTETILDLLADAVRLARTIGDSDTIHRIVERAETIARGSDVPSVQAIALHCRGLADHEPHSLERAAALYGAAHRQLPRAQALEAAGVAMIRRGNAAGRAHLDEAMSAYTTLGAIWDLSRLRTLAEHGYAG